MTPTNEDLLRNKLRAIQAENDIRRGNAESVRRVLEAAGIPTRFEPGGCPRDLDAPVKDLVTQRDDLAEEVRRLRARADDLARASERLIDCHKAYCSSFGPGMSDDAACADDVRRAVEALAGEQGGVA